MVIHWKDGILGEERNVRVCINEAIRALRARHRRRAWFIFLVALSALGVVANSYSMIVFDGDMALFGLISSGIAITSSSLLMWSNNREITSWGDSILQLHEELDAVLRRKESGVE